MQQFKENNFTEGRHYFEVKCNYCHRILEIERDTIMVICPCGYANEIIIKIEVEDV